jgi:hypothetical protein
MADEANAILINRMVSPGRSFQQAISRRKLTGTSAKTTDTAKSTCTPQGTRIEQPAAFDFHGFRAVYFFPYPESALMLTNADSAIL